MKKQILIALALLTLTSCSLTKEVTPTDFTGLYRAHIDAVTTEMKTASEKWGYAGNYEMKGSLSALADIPTLFSGSVRTDYEGIIHNYGLSQDSSITLMKPEMSYEMLLASGALRADEVSMITKAGDTFLQYSGMSDASILDEAVRTILAKYEGSWLSITDEEILSTLSGASEETAYKMSQALLRMSVDDARGYLRDYPLWKETKSLGVIDGLSTFEVELSRESVIALMDAFAEKSTGKKLDDESRTNLTRDIDSMNMRGRIGYDPADPLHTEVALTLGASSDMKISLSQSHDGWKVGMSASGSETQIDMRKNGDDRVMTAKIASDEGEIEIEGKMDYDGERFVALDMMMKSDDGISLKLRHEKKDGGNFEGSLDAGVGNLSWKGKVSLLQGLEGLSLKGAMIGSSLSLDLTPGTGGLLRGPLLIKNGDEKVIEANVGLRVDRERIDLTLDIPSPESSTVRTKAEISITGKREKTKKSIEIPKDAKPFSLLADEVSKAMPLEEDTWDEAIPTSLTGDTLPLDLPLSPIR